MIIDEWYQDLLARRSAMLEERTTVEGVRNAHLGPRWEFARVVVEAEPAAVLSVEVVVGVANEHAELLRAAIFGLLDVLLTAEPFPVRNVTLRILDAEIHPVDSTSAAFREAGRDAGVKILSHVKPASDSRKR